MLRSTHNPLSTRIASVPMAAASYSLTSTHLGGGCHAPSTTDMLSLSDSYGSMRVFGAVSAHPPSQGQERKAPHRNHSA